MEWNTRNIRFKSNAKNSKTKYRNKIIMVQLTGSIDRGREHETLVRIEGGGTHHASVASQ